MEGARQRALFGCIVACLSGIALPFAWQGRLFPHASWVLTFTGILGILLAFDHTEHRHNEDVGILSTPLHPRWARILGATLLMVGFLSGSVAIWRLWEEPAAWHFPLKLWLMALIAQILGGYAYGTYATDAPVASPEEDELTEDGFAIPLSLEIALFIGLVAIGIFLRVYRLGHIPPGIFVDETNAAGDALRLLDGWQGSPFGVGWYETPLLYAYYLAGLFKWLGTTYMALKLASLIPAILTLIAFYPLARTLFSPSVALTSLAFLAVNRWHMTMSRWGWNEVAPPLFLILTLYFLLLGSRKRHVGHFVLAGTFMGLGMYTYLASRLAAATVFLYILYRAIVQRGYLRRTWKGIFLFLLAYSITFGPLVTTYAHNPFTFLNRTRQVSILNDMRAQYRPDAPPPAGIEFLLRVLHLPTNISFTPLEESVVKHARMFFVEGDYNPRHNIPGAPMLDPVTGVLFLFGFLYAIWRWKDHRRGLLLLWVVVPMLGGVLSAVREAPQAYRTLTVVPAVCLLAGSTLIQLALTLHELLKVEDRHVGEKAPLPRKTGVAYSLSALIIVFPVILAGYFNVTAFFDRWGNDPRVWMAFTPMETTVARDVQAHIATHDIYLSPTLYWGSPVRFLTYRPASQGGGLNNPPFKVIQPVEDLPLAVPIRENALFLLEPSYKDLLELFTSYYPHTETTMVTGPRGEPLYLRVRIPLDDVNAIRGVDATYETVEGKEMTRREALIRHRWPDDFPDGAPIRRVRWTGSVFVPHSGMYDFRLLGGGILWVDDNTWSGPRYLGKGLHAIVIQQSEEDIGTQNHIAFQWQFGTSTWEDVPAHVLFHISPPTQGLRGTYYQGPAWEGPPLFSRVDRTLFLAWIDPEPIAGPFSVTWKGWIVVPASGSYRLRIGADDGVRLWMDGQIVGESLRPNTVNQVQVTLSLQEGMHAVQVDYFQQGGAKTIAFYWQPPGHPETIIPPSRLIPAPPDQALSNETPPAP